MSINRVFTSKKRLLIIPLLLLLLILSTSCGTLLGWKLYDWLSGDDGGNEGGENYSPDVPAIEARSTYVVPLGGAAPGRDELILTDESGALANLSGHDLRFEIDTDVVGLLPRPDFPDFASGSGAKIYPQKAGFAAISYYIDGEEQDGKFLAIVPPQSLIQMMVAEAGAQLTAEATVDSNYHVTPDSKSETADAIGAVTRNRVKAVSGSLDYSLFYIDPPSWLADPPASYYDAVIAAEEYGIYQYSPVDPNDPTHETYTNAEARAFLPDDYHRAYDQASLSAAYIFSEDTEDPTGGAYGFFSPDGDEWECIESAYTSGTILIPVGCGVSDGDFPELAPIQLIMVESLWKYPDGRPAFIFIRSRNILDTAVVSLAFM